MFDKLNKNCRKAIIELVYGDQKVSCPHIDRQIKVINLESKTKYLKKKMEKTMKYYPVYDSGTNEFLGLLLRAETISSNAEAVTINMQGMQRNFQVRFNIIEMYPSPKRFSYFPPVILSIELGKYEDYTQRKIKNYLSVCVPEQEKAADV